MRLSSGLFGLLACAGWVGVAGEDVSRLFHADFNAWTVTAAEAGGAAESISFDNPGLQLRMFPGPLDAEGNGHSDNALCLENRESCAWPMPGNFDPRRGTVSFWLSPQNWNMGQEKFQIFFEAVTPGFRMLVYKYFNAEVLYFYINFPGAPVTEKSYSASTLISAGEWAAGTWHKLDAVWDENGMTLYVDGLLPEPTSQQPGQYTSTDPTVVFSQPFHFPEAAANGVIRLNIPQSEDFTGRDPGDRTAFDDLRIYDRKLSAGEVRAVYELVKPSRFGMEPQPQRLTVPRLAGGDMAQAARVPMLIPHGEQSRSSADRGYASAAYDGENLYVLFERDTPPPASSWKERDAALWEDPGFELHLAGGVDQFQYIVNSAGALYDAKNADPNWNGSARTRLLPDGAVELVVPLVELGGLSAGDEWRANFCFSPDGMNGALFAWSGGGFFPHGELRFGDDSQGVRVEKIAGLANGAPEVLFAGDGLTGVWQAESGAVRDFGTPGDLRLTAGRWRLEMTSGDGFRYEHYFTVSMPLEISCAAWPRRGVVEAKYAVSEAGLVNRIRTGGVAGNAVLYCDGTEVARRDFTAGEAQGSVELPLPPESEGEKTCRIELTLGGLQREVDFRIPDLSPYRERVAVDHSVPPPWTPVVFDGGRRFGVLGREYLFGDAPFAEQMTVGEDAVFTRPPQLRLNGAPVEWTEFRTGRVFDDYIELSGTGRASGVGLAWRGELWFDGMLKINLTVIPEGETAELRDLQFSYALAPAFAEYVLTSNYFRGHNPWGDGQVEKRFDMKESPMLWLTGTDKGLLWWTPTTANWVNGDDEKQVRATRTGDGGAEVEIGMITRPAVLSKEADYTVVMMATPARPVNAGFRDFNFTGWGAPTKQNAEIVGWTTFYNYVHPQDMTTITSLVPRYPEEYDLELARHRERGHKTFAYSMPPHVGETEAEYDYFYPTWAALPATVWGYNKDGRASYVRSACGAAGANDWMVARIRNLFDRHPELGGLYFDVCNGFICENAEHGCGGIDAFGRPYKSSTTLHLRDFLLRVYKLATARDRRIVEHVSGGTFNPISHSFASYSWIGEEYYWEFATNPDYYYSENLSREEYQTVLNWKIKGVTPILLQQHARAADGYPHLKDRVKDFRENPEWAIRTLAPALVHDLLVTADWVDVMTIDRWWIIKSDIRLADAEFFGYWDGAEAASDSPGVLVSEYRWQTPSPYRRLFVVSNLGREAQPLAFHSPEPEAQHFELWNDRELGPGELQGMILPGNHFALIAIR